MVSLDLGQSLLHPVLESAFDNNHRAKRKKKFMGTKLIEFKISFQEDEFHAMKYE